MTYRLRVPVLFVLPFALLVAGCGQRAELRSTEYVSVPGGDLPPPSVADQTSAERPYLIGPYDKLSVNVYGAEDLSVEEVQADASGRIALPLVGSVEASGKTPVEMADAIEAALRGRYVRNPQVSVNVKEAVSQLITVDGQVQQPGMYPVVGSMTLQRSIATAKGLSEFAKLSDVVVFRTVNGQRMAALYNLEAIRRGYYPDPPVYARDVVVVGDSPSRRLFRDVLAAAPLLSAPLIYLVQ